MSTLYTQLTIGDLLAKLQNGNILLPRFQRRVVWSIEKREGLIRSIRNDWPIPAIMVAGTLTSIDKQSGESLRLIDGLQRTYTIKDFTQHLPRYIDIQEIFNICQNETSVIQTMLESKLQDLHPTEESSEVASRAKQNLSSAFRIWLSSCDPDYESGEEDSDSDQASNQSLSIKPLIDHLVNQFSLDALSLIGPCENLARKLEDSYNILNKQLNVIVYSGDIDSLPEIFTALNEGGQKLTKFELFASQWEAKPTLITDVDAELKELIELSYAEQIEAGFEVERSDEVNDEQSLHDYLFALSKSLCSKYSQLFGESGKDSELNEIGFNIAATAFGLGIQESSMRLLNDRVRLFCRLDEGEALSTQHEVKASLSSFFKALLDSCNITWDILGPYLSVSFAQTRKTESLHNNSQIISIVCRVLNAKYDYRRNFHAKPEFENTLEKLKKNIPSYYLIENLDETWKGAAAGKLWERVWNGRIPLATHEDGGTTSACRPSDKYSEPKSRDRLEKDLGYFFERDTESLRQDRKVKQSSKVFLKFFMIAQGLSVYELHSHNTDSSKRYEIEHLYPVHRFKRIQDTSGKKLPVNSIGNLAPLPLKLNRSKQSQTIKEYINAPTTSQSNKSQIERAIPMLCLEGSSTEEMIDSVKVPENDCPEDIHEFASSNGYIAWCKRRFEMMSRSVIDRLLEP